MTYYVTKRDLTNKKFCNHNMAGGFDGMGVAHVALAASHTQLKLECDVSCQS